MRRYIIRCADFACVLVSLSEGETAPKRLPIGSVGITLSSSPRAELEIGSIAGAPFDKGYTRAIVSHLLAEKWGLPLGVYSALLQSEPSEIEIGQEDSSLCSIRLSEYTFLGKREYKTGDGVALSFFDIEAEGLVSRVFPVPSPSDFSELSLRSLAVAPNYPSADISIALSVTGDTATVRSSHHPIPSASLSCISAYLSEHFPFVLRLVDSYTSTVFKLEGDRIILPFWCGEIV